MKYTDNYTMRLPEKSDYYNIEHHNENTRTIDAELKNLDVQTQEQFATEHEYFENKINEVDEYARSLSDSELEGRVSDLEDTSLVNPLLSLMAGGDLQDIEIEAGNFTNGGEGWMSYDFKEQGKFETVPFVILTVVDSDSFAQVKDITTEGFSYRLRTIANTEVLGTSGSTTVSSTEHTHTYVDTQTSLADVAEEITINYIAITM